MDRTPNPTQPVPGDQDENRVFLARALAEKRLEGVANGRGRGLFVRQHDHLIGRHVAVAADVRIAVGDRKCVIKRRWRHEALDGSR